MKILLEMRPALDGHSGIPQETRLLFRGLAQVPGIEMIGLLQSGNLVIEQGLPMRDGAVDPRRDTKLDIDRLSAVVVSLPSAPLRVRVPFSEPFAPRMPTTTRMRPTPASARRRSL